MVRQHAQGYQKGLFRQVLQSMRAKLQDTSDTQIRVDMISGTLARGYASYHSQAGGMYQSGLRCNTAALHKMPEDADA